MEESIKQTPSLEIEKKEYELPQKPILPSTYPDARDLNSNIPISSDVNVEYAKEWVDNNIK